MSKLKPMFRTLTALLVLNAACLAQAQDVAGSWMSCDTKTPWAYTLLSVEAHGSGHRWAAEWGATYAAAGSARFIDGEMVLHGCSSYRGEVVAGCDEARPPQFTRLKADDYGRVRSEFNAEDVGTARWVKLPRGVAWDTMARNCEAIVRKPS